MKNTVNKLFGDIDYFAECASKIAIENYKDSMRSNSVYSHDCREKWANRRMGSTEITHH